MNQPTINFDALLRSLLNSATVGIYPITEPLFFAHIERLSLSEHLNLDTMSRSVVKHSFNLDAPDIIEFVLKPEYVEMYKDTVQYPSLADYIMPTASMSKDELFDYLQSKESFTDSEIPLNYHCVGKVETVFSNDLSDEEKENYWRAWLIRNLEGDSFIIWDLGNSWCSFMCEGTLEALRAYQSEPIQN